MQLNFVFPQEVLAVLAIRYLDVDERGEFFHKVALDEEEKAKEWARILREINPRIHAILHPKRTPGFPGESVCASSDYYLADVSFVPPQDAGTEVNRSVLSLTSIDLQVLEGKSVTFGSSKDDGPVLIVWKGEPLTPDEFEAGYAEPIDVFANAAARVIGGAERILNPYNIRRVV